jgi:hypothetical protein
MIFVDRQDETGQIIAMITGVLIGSAIVLVLGLVLNSPGKAVEQARAHGVPEDELAKIAAAQKTRHTLYEMPMQWIGLAGIAFALFGGFIAWQEEHEIQVIPQDILLPVGIGGILLVGLLALTWSKRRKK